MQVMATAPLRNGWTKCLEVMGGAETYGSGKGHALFPQSPAWIVWETQARLASLFENAHDLFIPRSLTRDPNHGRLRAENVVAMTSSDPSLGVYRYSDVVGLCVRVI